VGIGNYYALSIGIKIDDLDDLELLFLRQYRVIFRVLRRKKTSITIVINVILFSMKLTK